jgi:hypothetical protein
MTDFVETIGGCQTIIWINTIALSHGFGATGPDITRIASCQHKQRNNQNPFLKTINTENPFY